MKSKSLVVLVIVMMLVAGAAQAKVRITLALRESQSTVDVYKKILADFMEENPNIVVEIANYDSTEFDEKVRIQMAGGVPPDLFYVHYASFPGYVREGALYPLQEFIDREGFDFSDYFPSAVEQYTWQGRSDYVIPRETSSIVLFYNEDHFNAAGLPFPSADWTWDGFFATARRLTRDDDGDAVPELYGMRAPYAYWQRNNLIWAYGGSILNESRDEFVLPFTPGVDALQRIADAITNKTAALAWPDRMATGKAAMEVGGFWYVNSFQDVAFSWDAALLPKGPAGRHVRTASGGYGIAANSPQPEEAWQVLRYLSGKEATLKLMQIGTIISARRDAAYSEAFLAGPPENRRVFVDSLEYGHVDPVTEVFAEMNQRMDEALAPVWAGEKSAIVAMKEIKPVIDALLSSAGD